MIHLIQVSVRNALCTLTFLMIPGAKFLKPPENIYKHFYAHQKILYFQVFFPLIHIIHKFMHIPTFFFVWISMCNTLLT